MSEQKERLDILLVKKNIFTSRERARASIMAGEIFVDDKRVDKCGEKVKESAVLKFVGDNLPYVSRGGLKLEKALMEFNIKLDEKICFDIGASTGGFTDCMLQNNAKKVYAIDVGYGQFAWKLRTDPRVVCMERTNIRYVTNEDIGEYGHFASIDVAFISLKKVILPVANLLNEGGRIVALIKPQFEAGRDKVGKKGVVKEPETHKEVIYGILDFIKGNSYNIIGLSYSPIRGPEGNIEYLVYFTKEQQYDDDFNMENVELVVNAAHESFE